MKYRKMLSNWQAAPIIGWMRLIETKSKETLVNWAVGYAEANFLPIYIKHHPEDHRPQLALEYARKWLRKEVKLPEAKKYILGCHEAGNKAVEDPAAQAAARAIGQEASSIHSAMQSLGLALYRGVAVAYGQLGMDAPWAEHEAFALKECEKCSRRYRLSQSRTSPTPSKSNGSVRHDKLNGGGRTEYQRSCVMRLPYGVNLAGAWCGLTPTREQGGLAS